MIVGELPEWSIRIAAFVFGAVWGSFFNVAIYRWPREMSVVTPASHCPACKAPVRAIHNVPIFGYLFLRGRAGCCGAKLSPRYPLVELTSALLLVALAEIHVVGAGPEAELWPRLLVTAVYFAFVGGLLIGAFVDLEWMELPDEVTLPGAALGLVSATFRAEPGVEAAAIGAGAGFLAIQVLFVWGYERLTGRRGMGEGDSKLLMMIGAFIGWQGALFAVVAGAFQGLLVAVVMIASGREVTPTRPDELEDRAADDAGAHDDGDDETDDEGDDAEDPDADDEAPTGFGKLKVPYGPFLALGALEYLFFGDRVVELYLSLFV